MKVFDRFRKKSCLVVIKVLISASLCALIAMNAEWSNFGHLLENVDTWLISLVFGCMILNVSISAVKWDLVLSIHGIRIGLWNLIKYYHIAVFFNNFLPTNIGGDGYRIYQTVQNSVSKSDAIIAVLVERITGLISLIFIGALSASYLIFYESETQELKLFLIVSLSVLIIFISIIIFLPSIERSISERTQMPKKIKNLIGNVSVYRAAPWKFAGVWAISIGFQMFSIYWMMLLVKAIGGELAASKLAVTMVVSNLAAILPVSINGLGLMDGSFVYIAERFGMDYDYAVLTVVGNRALHIPLSLIGGALFAAKGLFNDKVINLSEKTRREKLN